MKKYRLLLYCLVFSLILSFNGLCSAAYAYSDEARYEGGTEVTARIDEPSSESESVPRSDEESGSTETGDSSRAGLEITFIFLILSAVIMTALALNEDNIKKRRRKAK